MLILAVFVAACTVIPGQKVTNFEECVKAGNKVMLTYPAKCSYNGQIFVEEIEDTSIVGGDKDEHGCKGTAGYSWDKEVGACIRSWELNTYQRNATKIVTDTLNFDITILDVEILRCRGCFVVDAQRNNDSKKLKATIGFWELAEIQYPIEEDACRDLSQEDCLQNPECNPIYGPDICEGGVCTKDHTFKRCEAFSMPFQKSVEEFCGTSTESFCKKDSDCSPMGCSGQVCGNIKKDRDIVTTCDARPCYGASSYGLSCGCVANKCMWN